MQNKVKNIKRKLDILFWRLFSAVISVSLTVFKNLVMTQTITQDTFTIEFTRVYNFAIPLELGNIYWVTHKLRKYSV